MAARSFMAPRTRLLLGKRATSSKDFCTRRTSPPTRFRRPPISTGVASMWATRKPRTRSSRHRPSSTSAKQTDGPSSSRSGSVGRTCRGTLPRRTSTDSASGERNCLPRATETSSMSPSRRCEASATTPTSLHTGNGARPWLLISPASAMPTPISARCCGRSTTGRMPRTRSSWCGATTAGHSARRSNGASSFSGSVPRAL